MPLKNPFVEEPRITKICRHFVGGCFYDSYVYLVQTFKIRDGKSATYGMMIIRKPLFPELLFQL